MNRRPIPAAALAMIFLTAGCNAEPPTTTAPAADQPQSLPTVAVTINGTPLTLQVANDEKTREKGLMFTRDMPQDHGMIFVFPIEQPLNFWMKNTPIDLDIIYADHAGKVVAVRTMHAFDTSNVPSDEPATFAIELNAGAAAKLKVAAGDQLKLPPAIAKNVK